METEDREKIKRELKELEIEKSVITTFGMLLVQEGVSDTWLEDFVRYCDKYLDIASCKTTKEMLDKLRSRYKVITKLTFLLKTTSTIMQEEGCSLEDAGSIIIDFMKESRAWRLKQKEAGAKNLLKNSKD